MNPKTLVKISNAIGVISIILLVYWVFVFSVNQIFGFRVFRENMSETFVLSILGILALMAGSLIINVMFNLTRIAQRHNKDEESGHAEVSKKMGFLALLSFPLIFALLYGGDYLTTKKKEKMLVTTAQKLLENDPVKTDKMVEYSFTREWISETNVYLNILSNTEKNFPNIRLITKDQIGEVDLFLGFGLYDRLHYDTSKIERRTYVTETDQEERDYLNKVFDEGFDKYRYSAHDGNYELFYPYRKDDKVIVLSFSDYRRYGKIGS